MALVQAKYRGNDPWEKPLRYIKADKLKRYDGSEKEARLQRVARMNEASKPPPVPTATTKRK